MSLYFSLCAIEIHAKSIFLEKKPKIIYFIFHGDKICRSTFDRNTHMQEGKLGKATIIQTGKNENKIGK